MATYRASAGDTVSRIAWKFYGSTSDRVVEQVLEANQNLADLGETLPAGTVITLPEIAQPAIKQGVRLWD